MSVDPEHLAMVQPIDVSSIDYFRGLCMIFAELCEKIVLQIFAFQLENAAGMPHIRTQREVVLVSVPSMISICS